MRETRTPVHRPLEPSSRALVIGASSGIGAALVRELAAQGYRVAAVARREAKLAELCQSLNRGLESGSPGGAPRVTAYPHSVTRYEEVPALFQQIAHDLGGLDLVIYVAGIMPAVAPNEYSFAKDRATVEVNLLGAMAWLNEAAVRFERAGRGQIVGIGSIAGDRGRRGNPAYHTSKAALHTYLESLRNRLSQHGVCVTTIKPGMVQTALLEQVARPMWPISAEEAARQMVRAIARRRQTVYVPGRWALVSLIIRHLPSFVFRRMNF